MWRSVVVLFVLFPAFSCAPSPVEDTPGPATAVRFGECRASSEVMADDVSLASLHLPMRDGVRIALDVVLPSPLPEGQTLPAVLTMTRYWRAFEGGEPSAIQRYFATRGYAVITGDSRGTGASFGAWPYHRAPDETADFVEIIDWITSQPWSSGAVGGFGTSYTANTADWMAQKGHEAVKAIIPRFPDFDPYADLYFPGGIFHIAFGKGWGESVKQMDLNVPWGEPPRGIRPVDGPDGGSLLEQAVDARRNVPGVFEGLRQVSFRDDVPDSWGASMLDWSIHTHLQDLERAGTPMFTWGGWFDAGTAQGVIRRFTSLSNPQKAVIGPWSHGGGYHASPYLPADADTTPSSPDQNRESLCYFDHYLKNVDTEAPERRLDYYTIGEESWKTTDTWPPPGFTPSRWYFATDHGLASEPPVATDGSDRYTVDFDATTGTTNRWYTQRDGADVVYLDRSSADEKLLTYTSEPLPDDLEVTGTPVVRLSVSSTTADSAFFVYLEDVDPDGRVLYVTEGQLRALHRRVAGDPAPYTLFGPHHSYLEEDAAPMVPGEVTEVAIGLHPTSVLFRKGHRIRVAIAGADSDTFARVPESGTPTWTIARHQAAASHVELPIRKR